MSQVGRSYDVNANLIFKWRRDLRYRPTEEGEGTLSFLGSNPVGCEFLRQGPNIPFAAIGTRRSAGQGMLKGATWEIPIEWHRRPEPVNDFETVTITIY